MENKRLRVTDAFRILKNSWKFIPLGIFFLFLTVAPIIATAQAQRTVSGKVSDNTGAPLPGVSVVIKGTTNGIITDAKGDYTLQNVPSDATLTFSFIGMQSQDVVVGQRSVLNVTLEETTIGIEEVVAIGYGVQKKKLVTGATVQVNGEDLERLNTVSPMQALQSHSPGVNITETSGEPGSGFKVNIRGIGTMGNSQPLYVVDGVPRSDINYLPPSDIESIDILKDAASAAIYGARAANGVILVTTKKGSKNDKVTLSYEGYYGWQNVYKILPLLDAKEYMMIQDEANLNSGLKPNNWNALLAPGDYQRIMSGKWNGTNWLKEIENKNAPTQSHAVTISGGNAASVFSLGLTYTSQEGIFGKPVQSSFERYSFRINSEHTIFKSNSDFDILKIGENLSYTFRTTHGIGTGNMWWNDISNAAKGMPVLPIYATSPTDLAYPYHYAIPFNTNYSNPIAAMIYQRGNNLSKNHNINGNVYLALQPIKGLTLRSSFSAAPSFNTYRSWTPSYKLGPLATANNNITAQNMGGGLGWTFENTLNYNFDLSGNTFDILVGTSAERYGLGENMSTSNVGNVFNDFAHAYINNANIPTNASIGGAPLGRGGILSYFGRINYDYKETYMMSLIMRADGSSNFPRGNRWGYFPSVSAGWVITNESFADSWKPALDFFKIRASWGQNGNQQIPGFQYVSLTTFNTSNTPVNYYFGTGKGTAALGAFPSNIPTFNLKWETSEQLDVGFDARAFDSRLSAAFDYYIKTTKDWLVAAPILASWGVTQAPFINGGEIQNKGIELGLGWNANISRDFKYSINANMSYNQNKVTKIENSQGIINATDVKIWGNGTYIARAQVGYPIGYFYGYKTAGIFQNAADVANYKNPQGKVIMPDAQPGDVKFVDTNKDGAITELDKVQIGNPNPKFIYSLNLGLDFKGFDFSVTTYGVAGNQIARSWHDAGSPQDNYTTEILGRWHGEGTSNRIPRVQNGSSINQQYFSDLQIENGDYLRIQNMTLGYDFKKMFAKVPFGQLRFYVTGQNLYTFTKYSGMDPSIGTSTDETNASWVRGVDLGYYPNPRTIMIGASIKF
ncbi:MAG: SusC/RagA family TonB-linked outer membrane protein [Candidatus Saccharibacteria bacterium]